MIIRALQLLRTVYILKAHKLNNICLIIKEFVQDKIITLLSRLYNEEVKRKREFHI